jgi:co-chaperonin GroES (HSP10)
MKSELIPTKENVVLRTIERKKISDGGILLPDTISSYGNYYVDVGEVIAVGGGDPISDLFTKGNRVVYQSCDAVKVTIDKEDYLIINKEKILAVVNG